MKLEYHSVLETLISNDIQEGRNLLVQISELQNKLQDAVSQTIERN